MHPTPITDPADPRTALYRHVTDAELLREHGLFVAEGRLVVERVLGDCRYVVESLLLNRTSLEALTPALRAAGEAPVFVAEMAALQAITGFNIHRGCLALVRRPPVRTWRDAAAAAPLVVILEGVSNADNVGGVFRNAAAFGAAVLVSPTCCDPLYRKAIRTSMAAVLRVPFARLEPWPDGVGHLREEGFVTVALSPRAPAATLEQFASSRSDSRIALLIGTEGTGLTADAERQAAVRVRIPIRDEVDSLNLSVASGIALCRLSGLG